MAVAELIRPALRPEAEAPRGGANVVPLRPQVRRPFDPRAARRFLNGI